MADKSCRCHGHGCVECEARHPAGKTCNDCAHIARCRALFGVAGDETYCGWIPARFTLPPAGAR